jgi:outer membrane receptor protein involved in Fe transport
LPSGGVPATIGSEFSVFYSGDDVVGYRDASGTFYDAGGQQINPGDILLAGQVRNTNGQVTPEMFEDYEPQVTWMPRIGVSFPVTDQALFFASYGVVSQRPSSRTFASLGALSGTGGINNTNLKPEKTTKYELGFRQRIGARAALTISGFFHQIENLIQKREVRGATPSVYTSYENVDFGTVKGIEFGFDLRRTNGFSANLNYTLSFADGTGSGDATTSTITWVDETPPNFISPLDFDQRHKFNASIDYRLGQGEGPTIFGAKLLENFGVNVLATSGSGFPYTTVIEPFNLAGAARATRPSGGINSSRMPWQSRIDLRVDRRFPLGGRSSVTAFLWVENLLDQVNTNNVWRFTGLPDDDGFLSTSEGGRAVAQGVPAFEELYQHRTRNTGSVGIPRQTRLGVRVDF